ncbi:iron-containing redox enzyme family protein [Archangium sp.]|jgi:thiaminase|uniref:iron-containing redox enzyme family protein n=1 Tax=Archangium sp. TaxID=1872627 RepID=UPI002ED8233D
MNAKLIAVLEHESQELIRQLDAHPRARQLFEGTLDAETYAHYLVQTYHYVRWTTPLLALAGRRMTARGQHPVLAGLLLQKAQEETGHEKWLLADLRNLGWSAEAVEHAPLSPAVEAYVAWNRFTAEAGSPTAFLGTAYVLEALSSLRAGVAARNLRERSGIPGIHKAVTFLRGHGDADEGHVAELATILGSLTDPDECEALVLSARTTRALYPGLFEETMTAARDLGPARH